MFDWILECLFIASPAMVSVGLGTLIFTRPEKKVYYKGLIVGSVFSGVIICGLLALIGGGMGWLVMNSPSTGNGIAGGLLAGMGYVLILVAPVIGGVYAALSALGAYLFSAPLSENVTLGKRFGRAVMGSLVGVNGGLWILSLV